jgi:glycosyltransferase involved in cell wall biosynthesis
MPGDRVTLGYNAVDNAFFAAAARRRRDDPEGRAGLPGAPYFLTVCRFVPEKNLVRLIQAFARYRERRAGQPAWDLVLCGDGPGNAEIDGAIAAQGLARFTHRPGFLQADALSRWYAHASAFVLASLSEPWGLVVNEAAASGLPLLVSVRAGCSATLVPEPEGTTGARFDPLDVDELAAKLFWMASQRDEVRAAMGRHAAETVHLWGPDRFAHGVMGALDLARQRRLKGRDPVPTGATKVR